MKRLVAIICAGLVTGVNVHAGVAEQATIDSSTQELSVTQVDNLALLGKVWGYLKYHHPTVTGGCLDWDDELLARMPALLAERERSAFQVELALWIASLEDVDSCVGTGALERQFGPRLDWLSDPTALGSELREALSLVEISRMTNTQHYVSQQSGVGNPLFNSEIAYADREELDWRHRLLALYRFWNIIEYWFPYRDLIDADWDGVLSDFIPRLYAAQSDAAYKLELARLVATADDGHANLRGFREERPPAGSAMPPFSVRMVEGRPYVWKQFEVPESSDGPGDQLRIGDVILAVDGKAVERIFSEAAPYHGASNETARRRRIAGALLAGDDEPVAVTVERNGDVLTVFNRRVARASLDDRTKYWNDREGETFQMLSPDVAYLKLSTIDAGRSLEYIEAAAGTKGLVIDIRSYPASFSVFAIGRHLVTESTPFARFTYGDLSAPGAFLWTEPIALEPAQPHYSGKVVILVDESSISQSEYTAMAFRAAPEALVVGSQTAGADGNVSNFPLPGGYAAGISGIGVFYPDKSPTQRIGIVPDATVLPTIAGLREGRDEVLEVALRAILGEQVPEATIRGLAAFPR